MAWAAVAGIASAVATIVLAVVTMYYVRLTHDLVKAGRAGVELDRRTLGLAAYARAIDMLLEMKASFANQPVFFAKQMKEAGAGPAMGELEPREFLLIAASLWRLSYVFSVASTNELPLTDPEREGLMREMDLWLTHLPAFAKIYEVHATEFEAHNPEFLKFLHGLYAGEASSSE